MSAKTILVIPLIFFLITSFSLGQKSPQWKGKIEFENGIKVVKNPEQPLFGEIIFDLEENLSIGSTTDEKATFYNSVNFAVDSKDNILVLDRENCRIQKFNDKGDFLYTIGRKGQGPGEFTRPSELILDLNDIIYVKESRRLHVFNKTGEFIKSIPVDNSYRSIVITKEMNIITVTRTLSPIDSSEDVCLLSPDGNKIKTIANFLIPRPDYSSRLGISDSTIQHRLHLCPLNFDKTVYSFSSRYRFYVVNTSGKIGFIFEKDEQPISFTRKEKNQRIDSMYKRKKMRGVQSSRQEIENVYNFPETKPFFYSVLHDDKDNIYVLRIRSFFMDPNNRYINYDLFNKDGYYLYRVKTLHPPEIIKNGYLYNDRMDENGYIYIKRYKIKNWDQIKGRF